ncbi:hypothetical protein [Calothrix sp. 336/3]|uniref:hypothetical protein n=1 Tax=Calothrix sp. 336/3 TaxID=1337936 RepID=UPI0004E38C6D|nr:hypothetical protein [Calothrix sp. 336/3]AKG20866.1 hypothetical protein IJ00_05715 [Calothrix sp. 336/3]
MKTNLNNEYHLLLKLAGRLLKYFLLMMLGFAVVCIFSQVFQVKAILGFLLSLWIWEWIARIGVVIVVFVAIAIMVESSR